jgi:PAS domain S-box-containing protein
MTTRWKSTLLIIAATIVYIVAGKLSLSMALAHPSASPVWLPTGLALLAVSYFGYRVWPAIFIGAVVVNMTTAGTIATSLGIAVGNTLEAVVGAWFLLRWCGGLAFYTHPRYIVHYICLVAVVSTAISATTGVGVLAIGGHVYGEEIGSVWLTWWLGDAVSNLVIPPLILVWLKPLPAMGARRATEAVLILASVVLLSKIIFGGWFAAVDFRVPRSFFELPLLLWATYRFTYHGATLVPAMIMAIAIDGTLNGFGPYAFADSNRSLIVLQSFMGVISPTMLFFASILSGRQVAEDTLRESESRFRAIAENIREVFWVAIPGQHVLYISPAYETIWGRTRESLYAQPRSFLDSVHEADRSRLIDALQRQRRGEPTDEEYRVVQPRGTVRWIRDRGSPVLDEQGRLVHVVGIAEDITERKEQEECIRVEVQQRVNALVREIDHRVQNNLQIVSSLLNLQSRHATEPAVKEILAECNRRVQSMSLVHEKLYRTGNVSAINFRDYLQSLASFVMAAHERQSSDVELRLDLDPVTLDIDTAMPCGLIVNELLANSLKHAFPPSPGRNGHDEIFVGMKSRTNGMVEIIVRDNGTGYPELQGDGGPKTLGIRLVRILANQLGATYEVSHADGTEWKFVFPRKSINVAEPA